MKRLVPIIAVLVFLLTPSVAAAEPGWESLPGGTRMEFGVPATDGWKMNVVARGNGRVELAIRRGALFGPARMTTYRTSGTVRGDRLEADFSRLGHLSVEFEGKPQPLFKGLPENLREELAELLGGDCRGGDATRLVGRFRGEIRFRGEHGYATVDSNSATGEVLRFSRRNCPRREEPGLSELGPLRFSALAARGGPPERRRSLSAFVVESPKTKERGLLVALAGTREVDGDIFIARSAFVFGSGQGAFLNEPGPQGTSRLRVRLPAPFVGGATLAETAAGSRWTGTLAVRLAGAGRVEFAGPGFEAAFCRAASIKATARCVAENPQAFGPEDSSLLRERARTLIAQPRASQSQLFSPATRLSWSR